MSDEDEVIETEDTPAAEPAGEPERPDSHGPGLLLGVIVGAGVGAALATLLARGGDIEPGAGGGLLQTLRARMRDAAAEGREAAREKEAELMSRYEELTK